MLVCVYMYIYRQIGRQIDGWIGQITLDQIKLDYIKLDQIEIRLDLVCTHRASDVSFLLTHKVSIIRTYLDVWRPRNQYRDVKTGPILGGHLDCCNDLAG